MKVQVDITQRKNKNMVNKTHGTKMTINDNKKKSTTKELSFATN
jgi:hypothetical protein